MSSEHETCSSESSYGASPKNFSPHNSPLQQVPQMANLANCLTDLSCNDGTTRNYTNGHRHLSIIGVTDSPLCRACMEAEETPSHVLLQCTAVAAHRAQILGYPGTLREACGDIGRLLAFWRELVGNRPFLSILVEPQNHFRFRYKSEMIGTHGCLLGKTDGESPGKIHPTVELKNYNGAAVIRCRLAQFDSAKEHLHKLLEDDTIRDVSAEVPVDNSYKVTFPGIGIIHTAKKDVKNILVEKYSRSLQEQGKHYNINELITQCEQEAKKINLNIARLKFTAHDINTDEEICDPVYSEPIHNMKSAATNELQICRMSRCVGRPKGGDDVYIFVEKVNKKNIEVHFYEKNEDDEEVWREKARFRPTDVHHQFGIVFSTPPYRDENIKQDVTVYVELVRPSDGRVSKYKEFKYKAPTFCSEEGKRKRCDSFTSLSDSSVSFKSGDFSKVLMTIPTLNNQDIKLTTEANQLQHIYNQHITTPLDSNTQVDLGTALQEGLSVAYHLSPVLSQPNVPQFPRLDSGDMRHAMKDFNSNDLSDFNNFLDFIKDPEVYKSYNSDESHVMEPMDTDFNPDLKSDKYLDHFVKGLHDDSGGERHEFSLPSTSREDSSERNRNNPTYSNEDATEVKKLVKEICNIIRNKAGPTNKVEIKKKMKRLIEMRMSNGDTFLHMSLRQNQPSLQLIVKYIHKLGMTELLNYTNRQHESILHLAVMHGRPDLIQLFLARGCNPMLEDSEGNNLIHYAVLNGESILGVLLDAIDKFNVTCNLDAYNNDKQTALHLARVSEVCTRELIKHGANYLLPDQEGRTALHLAAYYGNLPVVRILIDAYETGEIDTRDGEGYTALQMACGGDDSCKTVEIVRLLLEKGADPLSCEGNCKQSAWKLAFNKPPIREAIQQYVPMAKYDQLDVKSEPEDEYESCEEDDGPSTQSSNLSELPSYIQELSATLDVGGWEPLAVRLQQASLSSWFANTPSPTQTLLKHVKECDETLSSRSLVLLLEEMGLISAANIIRKYID